MSGAVPDPRSSAQLVRAMLWRRLDVPSLEHGRLLRSDDGHVLDGRIVTLLDGDPADVHYVVRCRSDWVTLSADVSLVRGRTTRRLQLRRDADGRWWRTGEPVAGVEGVTDVDVQLTPSTNTLPIRRLGLDIGESRALAAVWVRFPDLDVARLEQRYTRVGTRQYRYESGGGAFSAELDVDDDGVVERYGKIWERAAF